MKKLLFIVNGLGLGNSTRCEAIIESLTTNGHTVDIITSGNGKNYFENKNFYNNLYEFRSFYYVKNKVGKLSIWRTVLYIPKFILFFFRNSRFLKSLIQSNNYSGIVIDSDYTILFLKYWLKIPVFALNNACVVVNECKKLPVIPREIRMQYLIEKCDDWYHQTIPDVVLVPTLKSSTVIKKKSFIYLPSFIRGDLHIRPPVVNLKRILVMLSGSHFKMSVKFLNKLQIRKDIKIDVLGSNGKSNDQITFYGKVYDNKDYINKADMMIINAGFSALSEAILMHKPLVIVPIPNHAEQHINAKFVEKNKLGLVTDEENIVEKTEELINRFSEFVENHRLFSSSINGANQAADIIINKIEKYKI